MGGSRKNVFVVVDQNTKEDDQELAGVWKLRHIRESFGNTEDHGKDWMKLI